MEVADSPSAYLRALIATEGGSISVERFVQEALYHPRFGYYVRQVKTVGRTGDFSTAATLHPALGSAVAAWTLARRMEVAAKGRWHLIELGGGTGELAANVLKGIGWRRRLGLTYHLVELSEGLRARQQKLLGTGNRVRWHERIDTALAAANGRALIFSNEFVDAFPCVQLTREPCKEWREVRVIWPEDAPHPQETTAAWQVTSPSSALANASNAPQRIEVHESYRQWLASWVERWQVGRLLTIDYGNLVPALYDRQPRGTLRAYFRHLRFTGPEVYHRFGRQDLTADVNFTDLQTWGAELGLSTTFFLTQAQWMKRWLSTKQTVRFRDASRFTFLLDPAGAGGAFKVLEQSRQPLVPRQNAA